MVKKRLLIAEDDRFLTDVYMRAMSQRDNMDVKIVQDGDSALREIDAWNPDLLVLDLHMPKTDGFYVLERLHERGSMLPVIVLTNLAHPMDRGRCEKLGVSAYFVKSQIELKDLWKTMENYLKL